jgi:hypothetical protein
MGRLGVEIDNRNSKRRNLVSNSAAGHQASTAAENDAAETM